MLQDYSAVNKQGHFEPCRRQNRSQKCRNLFNRRVSLPLDNRRVHEFGSTRAVFEVVKRCIVRHRANKQRQHQAMRWRQMPDEEHHLQQLIRRHLNRLAVKLPAHPVGHARFEKFTSARPQLRYRRTIPGKFLHATNQQRTGRAVERFWQPRHQPRLGIFGNRIIDPLMTTKLRTMRRGLTDNRRETLLLGLTAALAGVLVSGVLDHYLFNLSFPHAATLLWLVVALGVAAAQEAEYRTDAAPSSAMPVLAGRGT